MKILCKKRELKITFQKLILQKKKKMPKSKYKWKKFKRNN